MWHFKLLGHFALGALVVSTQAIADRGRHFDDDDYYVNAKVVRVKPIVRVVEVATPREVCWDERVRHVERRRGGHSDSPLPVIVGGVVGGVVGNQIGRRHHRDALTIAGSVIGAAVGHSVSRERHHPPRRRSYTTTERHCEIETDYREEERIDGYDVTYRYNGRHFTTRTDHEPGKRIRVRVQVEPALDNDAYFSRSERRHRRADRFCRDDCFDT